MLIVAERINASRKAIRTALEKRDAAAIVNEVRIQTAAGAHYIDVNGGTFPGREAELTQHVGQGVFQAGFDALKRAYG